jgi:TolB protein
MINRFALLLLLLAVVTGCSLDGEAGLTPTARPAAGNESTRSVLTGHALSGRLLYVRDGQIWMYQDTEARAIALDGSARDPAWSPDGRRIAYIRRDESFSDLYVMDVASGQSTQVTFNGRSDFDRRTQGYVHQVLWATEPAWSPEGDEVIFLSQEQPAMSEAPLYEYPLSLYRYSISLLGTREPLNSDMLDVGQQGSDILSPAWSPDGRYLAYVQAPRGNEARRIMLYDFETGQAGPYPGIPAGAYDPAWSADGSRLAFAVSQDGLTDIWMIAAPPSNGTPQRVTDLGRARAPSWSPEGMSMAFLNVGSESTDLYVVELTNENERLVAGEPIAITEGAQIDATAGLSWGR